MDQYQHYIESRIIGAKYRETELEWLNRMGKEGWCLTAVVPTGASLTYYFGRMAE